MTSCCSEQGKLPAAKAFKLAERDKDMSEQKKPSFMQELDQWTDAAVINALHDALMNADEEGWKTCVETIKAGIRHKVLESYRNGQQAGPRTLKPARKGGR